MIDMTRLHQCRSAPSKFLSISKRTSRSRTCSRRLAQSTGSLQIRQNCTCHCKFRCDSVSEKQNETFTLTESRLTSQKEGRVALGLFCALLCSQCCVWNTWAPIAGLALRAFPNWNESLVALLSDWGCISYLTCCVPSCWLLYRKDLVMSLQMAAILSTLATLIRCVSTTEDVFTMYVN
ncbi:uncharacterized protein LOC109863856 [Pseudomyrmex gracilis]|uniref:uncharacterized protein LOC109863856 n=1 Tax=Pseudomyrmex gracilis TaxID=219809 RepID=UPI000994A2BC|nr:uncharacterized protein LOC109863856 [Pseudomyrmex gracilis]